MGNVARRSNREGSVHETAEGRWRPELNVTNNTTGEEVRMVLSARTRAAVVTRLEAVDRALG